MSKHVPASYGFIREDKLMLEWDEQENKVTITNTGVRLSFTYEDAGSVWRMLCYLFVPTDATGRYR
jgi:hypothetical protein